MRMELIQPFINAADAVFLRNRCKGPTKIGDLLMEEGAYHRKGVAALIVIKGDIEGRIILDLETDVALKVAAILTGAEVCRQRTNRSRNGLRTGQHGHRKFRYAV